ncbi:response regulator transcription factor [Variovorax sp. 770b2]|uniref:response regulator transcription factor n=1 Tax=Variovorax sp. 770b2 TaxID=1566271 RepID=UPI0008F2D610|nr:response regulator transcription factor [Variovorax sp. 770b2]SFQ04075.1 DNA-binding response regulator, OmpR family, contains REC and winged-helix (wHTH) domain [Variovorax sp. 770b2]
MARILVVEDDPLIGAVLQNALRRAGHETTLCANGEEGFFLVMTSAFDLLILDVVLPGRNGLDILAGVRRSNAAIPVLMLSTLDEVSDRVRALSLHADDYLGKPFALEELLARAGALLRRVRPIEETRLRVADLNLDLLTRNVTRGGHSLKLTLREFELLTYLMKHSGRVVSKNMLAQDIWENIDRATPIDNIIDVHISRLRRKLDAAGRTELLRTVRGIGFCLDGHEVNNL